MFEPNIATEIREKIDAVFYPDRVVPAHTEYEHYYRDSEDNEVYPSVTTKTSLLSRKYYKQMAADKAVEHIQTALINGVDDMGPIFDEARKRHITDLEQAGTWGTHGHDMVDGYVSDWIKNAERPDDIVPYSIEETSPEGVCSALGAMKFFDDYTLFPIVSEKKIISKKHRYGGTLDSLWLVGEVYKERTGISHKHQVHVWANKGVDHVKCMECGREEKLILTLIDWKTSNMIFGRGSMGKYDYAMQVAAYNMALVEMTGIRPKKHWIVRLDKKKPSYEIGYITDIKRAGKAFIAMNTVSDFARSREEAVSPLIRKDRIIL